ncbi:MAG: DUF2480 family protein [Spirosomataceae bacterium]
MEEEIINKVAASGLITFNLEDIYPVGERVIYDMKDNLFMGLILKEKDFRQFLKENDWSMYKDKYVAVICSEDAIIPQWAFMLLTLHLQPHARLVHIGDLESLEERIFLKELQKIDFSSFENARVVVKGCSKITVPSAIYSEVTQLLSPHVKSLMFGEPCSTVPLFKRK